MALSIGDSCPAFRLQNQEGEWVDSKNVIGTKNLVIYFYPKDDTPGCTAEACSFRDSFEVFKDHDCDVIGISSDSVEKHKEFALKHRLSFTLLADVNKEARKAFQVPTNFLGLIPGRVTYIVNKAGKIVHIFNSQMNAEAHITESLAIVKKLK
jgi:peroxiredoxin Q/BCP